MKRKPWYQQFQVLGYVGAGLAVLSTGIVIAAKYINLPKEVEAAQQKNVEQDQVLTHLDAIEATNSKLLESLVGKQKHSSVDEVADDGEIKVLLVDGKKLCCDGTTCWPWHPHTQCER